MGKSWIKYFFGLILFGVLLYSFLRRGMSTTTSLSKRPQSPKDLIPHLKEFKELAPFVFSQWQFESGNFNSSLYQRAANGSGMRIAQKREQVRTGESNGYAVYKDWQQCAEDLVLYFRYVRFPQTIESVSQYAFELKKRSYFGAELGQYTKGVQFYFNKL